MLIHSVKNGCHKIVDKETFLKVWKPLGFREVEESKVSSKDILDIENEMDKEQTESEEEEDITPKVESVKKKKKKKKRNVS